jgi:hypothetical protein
LPPYSPDFNPIEMALSKVKGVQRSMGERTVGGLFDAIGMALARVTLNDAQSYITHCGYGLQ